MVKLEKNVVITTLYLSIGNIFVWYEFMLYAYFATVISKLFFSTDSAYVAMTMTLTTFVIGLASRPVGGVIFGCISDKFGRRKTLVLTVLLMSFFTLCIGLLPTYKQIGIASPICLIGLRILQGIALGGEFGVSCSYLFELAPTTKKDFFGSIAVAGGGLGMILSFCTIFIIEKFVTQAAIYDFAWRIPFFISIFSALLGLCMPKFLVETKNFVAAAQNNKLVVNPFVEMLKNHKATLLNLFAILMASQTSFFLVFSFDKTMAIKFLNQSSSIANKFTLSPIIGFTIATILFGYLSDKINKKNLIFWGSFGIFLSIYPFILFLRQGISCMTLLFSFLMGALTGMVEGALNSIIAESFPTKLRTVGTSFCWNFTAFLYGGTALIVTTWLIGKCGIVAVAYYLMTACSITILTVLSLS